MSETETKLALALHWWIGADILQGLSGGSLCRQTNKQARNYCREGLEKKYFVSGRKS